MSKNRDTKNDHKSRLLRALPTGDHMNDLKSKFETYEDGITTAPSRRRPDLEKFAVVVLAIGRHPDNPPQWAINACVEAYETEAKDQGALLDRKGRDYRFDLLEETIIQIIDAHPENFSLFYESGPDQEPTLVANPTKIEFNHANPKRTRRKYSFAAAVKDVLRSKHAVARDEVPDLKAIEKRWRNLSPNERLALIERCNLIYRKERNGIDTLQPKR